jgi:hypothetical protein
MFKPSNPQKYDTPKSQNPEHPTVDLNFRNQKKKTGP